MVFPAFLDRLSRKVVIAEKIGGRALRADAMETATSGWLSEVVVISSAHWRSFGCWSRKAVRLGLAKRLY
jgi:hypothetical protein